MSTSIRRPRNNSRVRSVSFQSLGWVLVRVAVERIAGFDLRPALERNHFREHLAQLPTYHVRALGERIVARMPARRYRAAE